MMERLTLPWKRRPPLVGSDRAVELNAEATVYLNFAVTVGPRYAEFDNALRLYETLKKTGFLILGMLFDNGFKGFENLFNSLKKLRVRAHRAAEPSQEFPECKRSFYKILQK